MLTLLSVFVGIRLSRSGLVKSSSKPRSSLKLRVQKPQINNLDGNYRYEAVPAWTGESHPFDFMRRIDRGVGIPKPIKADRYPTQKHRAAK